MDIDAEEELEGFVKTVFGEAWETFKNDIVLFILAGLLVAVVGGVTLGILIGPLMVGFVELTRKRLRGQPGTATDVFSGFQKLVPAILAGIVIGLAVIIGSILCILPGLAVAWAAMFAFHFMAYKDQDVGDCLKNSFELAKANIGPTLVLFLLVGFLNGLGNAVALGGLLTFPFGLVAVTVAFEKLTGNT
jgi:uncharacterized membrane protein